MTSIQENILKKIQNKQIVMHSRLYFVLQALAVGALASVIFFTTVGIGSYILMSLRLSHHITLPTGGYDGVVRFLGLFPWWLLVIDIVALGILEVLMRRFQIGYRHPLAYTLTALVAFAGTMVLALDLVHAPDTIVRYGHQANIPFVRDIYERERDQSHISDGICPCRVVHVGTSTITFRELRPFGGIGKRIEGYMPPDLATSSIHVGDFLFLLGEYHDGVFVAQRHIPWNPPQDDDSTVSPDPRDMVDHDTGPQKPINPPGFGRLKN